MLKFFKRLIWRLKNRNINLMVRPDKSYIDYLYDNFGSSLEVDRI